MEAKWCAPGDDQQDRWLVRFNDHDMRDALFTGPDAETEAWAKWDMMCGQSGTWNGYLFRLAARPTADLGEDGELERLERYCGANADNDEAVDRNDGGADPLTFGDLRALRDRIEQLRKALDGMVRIADCGAEDSEEYAQARALLSRSGDD